MNFDIHPQDPTRCPRCGGRREVRDGSECCPRCEFSAALEPCSAPETEAGASESRGFGDYELLEEIAHGGMGVVYRARHVALDRVVALKMLLLGQFASDLAVKRFHREAAAAAALRHPGIVNVFEVGEVEGQHYFTMELVEGRSLASMLQGGPLPPRTAAGYLRALCEAVAHAHAQGIVHRDLKPSNILIDPFDAPRITDFGLARRLDGTGDLTLTGHIVGSPNYLAPELLEGVGSRVDRDPNRGAIPAEERSPENPGLRSEGPPFGERGSTSADLFSLGAVLYETITGRPPFLGSTLEQTLLRVRDSEPVAPRVLQANIPQDLETICLKCLEKDPARRYAGAGELADELGRFLEGKPILARPIAPVEKVWRWARRKPLLAGFAVAFPAAIALGLAGILWQWRRAEDESHRAQQVTLTARDHLVRQWVATGNDLSGRGRMLDALPWYLAALENEPDSAHLDAHRRRLTTTLRAAPRSEHVWFHSNRVTVVTLSPDERWVASGSMDRTARVWDLESGNPLTPPLPHGEAVRGIGFSPHGRRLLTYSSQRVHRPGLGPERGHGAVRLWTLPEGRELWSFEHTNVVDSAMFSPDGGRFLSSCADGRVRVWLLREEGGQTAVSLERELLHPDEARSAAFGPDGTCVATASRDGKYRLWEVSSGSLRFEMQGPPSAPSLRAWDRRWAVAFSPDGRRLAGYRDFMVRIWDVKTSHHLCDITLESEINSVAWHPDGRSLVTVSRGGSVEIWSAADGIRRGLINNQPFWTSDNDSAAARFGPDGNSLLSWDRNGINLYPAESVLPREPFLPANDVSQALLTLDGRRLVMGDRGGRVWVWNLVHALSSSRSMKLGTVGSAIRFSPDDRRLVTGDISSSVAVWDPGTGRSISDLPHLQTTGDWGIQQIAIVPPEGRRVLATDAGGTMRLYELTNGLPASPLWTNSAGHRFHAAFLPDGQHFLTADFDGVLRLIRAEDGTCLRAVTNATRLPIRHLVMTRDGRYLVTVGNDAFARRWNPMTLEVLGDPMPVGGPANNACLSPDQNLLLTTCTAEGRPRVWDVATGRLVWTLDYPEGHQSGHFSPDGRWMVVCGQTGGIRIWDAVTGSLVRILDESGFKLDPTFSPDSRWLASAGEPGVRVWDLSTLEAITPVMKPDPVTGYANAIDWSPDSTHLAGVGDQHARIWDLRPAAYSDSAWRILVVALVGNRIAEDGRLSGLSAAEFSAARDRAKRDFLDEFTPDASENADFLWLQNRYLAEPEIGHTLRHFLDLAIPSDPPDNPETGRSEMRHRRALLRLRTGDAQGAAEDKPDFRDFRRDPACTTNEIDLSRFYNTGLGPWGFSEPGLHLGDLMPGRHRFGGVWFDARGAWLSDGDNPGRGSLPRRIVGIPVGARGATLHVLQGANYEAAEGVPIGDLVLHYVDGEERRITVRYGHDTRNWWTVQGEPRDTPKAEVVWQGQCPFATSEGHSLRLYRSSFPNPRPEIEVRTIDAESAMNRAGLFVVAMTFE